MSLIYLDSNNKVCLAKDEGEKNIELEGDFKGGNEPQWKKDSDAKSIPQAPDAIDMRTGEIKKLKS